MLSMLQYFVITRMQRFINWFCFQIKVIKRVKNTRGAYISVIKSSSINRPVFISYTFLFLIAFKCKIEWHKFLDSFRKLTHCITIFRHLKHFLFCDIDWIKYLCHQSENPNKKENICQIVK